ncbi:Trans-aconitate 2-methyltransferase 2 [Colletotrichum chlorophyti]|uniref:Trans-aconitate 2-methyltransferase 2 n=1 Tax=Colletotrichum chlorophyti TaxID=708187 RepID=A0A1Q8RYM5_9PEZI|nr:Trans-aconitate 2-methyltransferase 2 [Colletotrichum chlorophyti]
MAETAQQPPIDDNQTDDGSSSLGGSYFDESVASLRSSILDYRRENGRTYHRISDGKYYLPNDEQEQDRLDFTHQMWMITWDGELCLCPKKDGAKRVLDCGTGTGIWALDYADARPEATVLGVDLSAIQPEYVPPNLSFEIDDLEKDWTWSKPFDFIFCRAMNGAFVDWPRFLAQAYDNLEPGGYLEIHEGTFPVFCDDDTMKEDYAILKWSQLLIESTDKIGRSITMAPKFTKMLEEAGFEDVQEKIEKMPVSPWPTDPKQKQLGVWTRAITNESLEAMSLALFTRVLGWTKEETLVFCAEVRQELRKNDVHAYFKGYGVYGRKPLKEQGKTEEAGTA